MAALYAFARTADDLADEGQASPDERLQALALYRLQLQACIEGRNLDGPWPDVFGALAPVIGQFALPVHWLTDLLSAFEQDVVKHRYQSQAELLDYCRRSANPVGRLLLHLYGVDEQTCLKQSDDICTALQLINFWQDLSVDLPRGRLYLPADLLLLHGLDPQQLLERRQSPQVGPLIERAVSWAEQLMLRGLPLARRVPGRAGWELRLVVQGGLRIAQQVRALGPQVLHHRPRLGRLDVARMLWRSVRM